MTEVTTETPDRTISVEKSNELLSKHSLDDNEKAKLSIENNIIQFDFTESDVKFQFISVRDGPEISKAEENYFTVVSRYLIYIENEVLEVDIDTPFELRLSDLSLDIE